MSNNLAAGNAQNAGDQANQNGQQGAQGGNGGDANETVVLSPEDQAAQAAADAADGQVDGQGGGADPGADGGEGGDGAAGGGRRSASERISEVVAERNAAMEYGNYWREQAFKLQQQGGGAGQQQNNGAQQQGGGQQAAQGGQQQGADDPQPTLEQFGFDAAKWASAHAAWVQREVDRRAEAAVERRLSTRDQQAEQRTVAQTWNDRVAEFKKTAPDFDMVTRNPTLPITEHMAGAIMRSELGPQMFHHLAKNPPEAARIARLSPQAQREQIARLEGRLEAQRPAAGGANGGGQNRNANGQFAGNGQQGQQQGANGGGQSRAPAPPTGTRGGGNEVNLNTSSLSDYLAARLPHIAAGRGSQVPGGRNAK